MNSVLRIALCTTMVAGFCFGQPGTTQGAPRFEAGRVLPSGGDRSIPLAPGLLISIYGDRLGPAVGCEGHAEALIYPKELCETQVLVGGLPAGLLYVQERQINFQVPRETPVEGSTEIQVVYKGQSSLPVTLPLGLVAVWLDSPAKVGMPVWLRVSANGSDRSIQYPISVHPANFGCSEVEVRRNGKLLPRFATLGSQAFNGLVISGPLGGSLGLPSESHHKGRIPLHLQYRFDQPGTYEVRYTSRGDPKLRSPWTPIEILPETQSERARWLRDLSTHAPGDTVELLTDWLPNLLGFPDQQSLEMLTNHLYHPDRLVREYAMYGLTYWPAQQAEAFVRRMISTKGPSDVGVQFLIPKLLATDGDSLVEEAIRYLRSNSPVLLRGAVTAIYRIALAENLHVKPGIRARAEDALIRATDHVVSRADTQTVSDYACALGTSKDDRAGAVLWDFADRKIVRGQALIALPWRHAPADLPKLAQLTLAPANGQHFNDGGLASLPYALRRGYGDAAIPYMETMLERSEFTWVRTQSARELMLAGRPAGFAFMVDAMEHARMYRGEMVEFVRGQFPELRQADDAAVLAFVKARATAK